MKPKHLMGDSIAYNIRKKNKNDFIETGVGFPIPYDLVSLKIIRKKILPNYTLRFFNDDDMHIKLTHKYDIIYLQGWWTGHEWDGYKLLKSDKVLAWKKTHTEDTR